MAIRFLDAAEGLNLNESFAFSAALSAAPAGSTHHLLTDGIYTIWADQPFAVFFTNAAIAPTAVPAAQPAAGDFWPGALVPAGSILQFQMDSTTQVQFGGFGPLVPTGFRAWQLGAAAGTFYLTEFRMAVR